MSTNKKQFNSNQHRFGDQFRRINNYSVRVFSPVYYGGKYKETGGGWVVSLYQFNKDLYKPQNKNTQQTNSEFFALNDALKKESNSVGISEAYKEGYTIEYPAKIRYASVWLSYDQVEKLEEDQELFGHIIRKESSKPFYSDQTPFRVVDESTGEVTIERYYNGVWKESYQPDRNVDQENPFEKALTDQSEMQSKQNVNF